MRKRGSTRPHRRGRYIVRPAAFDVIATIDGESMPDASFITALPHVPSTHREYANGRGSQEFIQTAALGCTTLGARFFDLSRSAVDDHFCAGKMHALIIDFPICISLTQAAARSNFTPVKHFEMRWARRGGRILMPGLVLRSLLLRIFPLTQNLILLEDTKLFSWFETNLKHRVQTFQI